MTAFAEAFSGIFEACGQKLVENITGILPTVLVLLMVFNTVCHLIGSKRIERLSVFLARYRILSYTVLPLISWFFLCNPAAFTSAKFLPQRQRAGYVDACTTFNSPLLGLFPHVNPGELFVWLGIAIGVEQLGFSTFPVALRFFLAACVLAVVRSFVTEGFWVFFAMRQGMDVNRPASVVVEEEEQKEVSEPAAHRESGVLGTITWMIQGVGNGIGMVVEAFFTGAKEAVSLTLKSVLPFLIFLSFMSGVLTYTGVGSFIARLLTPLLSSIWGVLIFTLIISFPLLSPVLAPGAAIPCILGTLIGTMIAAGSIPVTLAIPALFAVNVVDGCDFVPTAAALGQAEPDTAKLAMPSVLFSRFVTAPIAILLGVVASIGLF